MSSNLPPYRFSVYINSVTTEVRPIYDNSVAVQYNREGGTAVLRPSVDGSFTFVRADFELLNAIGMEDDVEFTCEEFTGTWNLVPGFPVYWRRTDMEIDEDNRIITVQPLTRDRYEDIFAAMDKEFNLAQMDIPLSTVRYSRAPLIQLYVRGSNYLTNYIGGTHWEVPVAQPVYDPYELLSLYPGQEGYRFGNDENSVLMFVTGDDTVLSPDVSGEYVYNGSGNNYVRADGAYEVRLNPALSLPNFQWQIVEKPSNTVVFQKPTNVGLTMPNGFDPHPTPFQGVISPGDYCDCFQVVVYGRVLCNGATFNGSPTFDVPELDIVPANPNYSKVAPFAPSTLLGSIAHQTAPSIYGRFWEGDIHWPGEYFVKPNPDPSPGRLYPISNSDWRSMSSWFYIDSAFAALLEAEAEEIVLEDAWKLPDILAAILAEVEPGVTHTEDAAHSDFFYAATNVVRGARKYPIFAPKSNVKLGEYDKPASRAILKLGELLAFLRDAFGVYWYVDTANRFRLEHVRFFRNGLSYTGPEVDADLTAAFEPKTAKLWGYRSSKYRYDKPALPEQIRFKWMDKVSPPFEGYPIDMRSAYVQKGNIEERVFAVFTSDIEFIMAQPDAIADDGFVFFDTEDAGDGTYSVPFIPYEVEPGEDYVMQNGWASLLYLVDTYLRDDLPAELVRINKQDATATSVKRSKIQEVDFPGGLNFDPYKLVRTMLGDGAIRSLTIALQSRGLKITIEHDIP